MDARRYAGRDTTAEEDLVCEGREEVGTPAAGGSHTATGRVELTLQVEDGGGSVTIVPTVRTGDATVTVTDAEQVARARPRRGGGRSHGLCGRRA